MAKLGEFDVGGFLKSQGMTLEGLSESGAPIVSGKDGQRGEIDINSLLASQGLSPDQVDIKFNDSSSALDISPLDVEDRKKLAFGNAAGSIKYLKNKFEDAAYDKDKGFTVKKNGVWHTVDPSGLGGGSAWDKTKELVKDITDLADIGMSAVVTAEGAAKGAAAGSAIPGVGNIAGGIAGAAVGGAGAGAIKTSLGRLYGTYEADASEQIKDIGLEALLNAGGQTVAVGARPVLSQIGKALASIPDKAKPVMAKLLAVTTKAEPDDALRMIDRNKPLMTELAAAKVAEKGLEGADATFTRRAMERVGQAFGNARKMLSAEFDAAETSLLANAEKGSANVAVNPLSAVGKTMEKFAEEGLVVAKAGKDGSMRWAIAGEERLKNWLNLENGVLDMRSRQALASFVSTVNEVVESAGKNGGVAKGADGLKNIMGIRRAFDTFYFKTIRANESAKGMLTPISHDLRSNLVGLVRNYGDDIANQYASMNSRYATMLPTVAQASRVAKTEKGVENYVKRLFTSAERNISDKNMLDAVGSLKGASELVEQVKDIKAARQFATYWPQFKFTKDPVKAAVSIAAGPLTSPKAVARGVQAADKVLPYAQQFGQFMKGLTPQQMRALMQQPEVLETAIRTTIGAYEHEQAVQSDLLKQAGALP